jgi:glycosyltransferase involved in cell wall biosynthesis
MKILNVSYLIPLDGLAHENDIILRTQDHLKEKYNYEFRIAKCLPFAPGFLGIFSKKWKYYNQYLKKRKTEIQGYSTIIYPWILLPTGNLWAYYLLIPLNLIFYHLFIKKRLLEEAKKADLILAQKNEPDALVAYLLAKKTKKPYILNLRRDFQSIILNLPILKNVYRNASCMITPNPQKYRRLKEKININLIPHPIEKRFFNEQNKTIKPPVTLISVCRLLDWKHIDWVLKSLGKLKELNYHFVYKIIGNGPELEYLKQLTVREKLNDYVFFHGYKDYSEIDSYLKNAHVFIMPSYPETLGRAFLEAAASDCLVMGHKNTGVDGLLKHKESAIFVDENSITDELKNLFQNFNEAYFRYYLGNARKVVDNLTWENIGRKYNELYSNAIGKYGNE